MGILTDEEIEWLRQMFEMNERDSYDSARSRKGTYRNPAVSRDWRWFLLGASMLKDSIREGQP